MVTRILTQPSIRKQFASRRKEASVNINDNNSLSWITADKFMNIPNDDTIILSSVVYNYW